MSDIEALKQRLDELRNYKFNWVLSGSEAPSKKAIDNTEKLLDLLSDGEYWLPESPDDIDAYSSISIYMDIFTGRGKVELLIYEDEICFAVDFIDGYKESNSIETDFSEIPVELIEFLN